MKRNNLLFLFLLPLAVACGKNTGDIPGMTSVSYEPTDAIIANPERGFYSPNEVHGVSNKGISQESFTANRKLGRTLYLLEFHLKDYVNCDIAEDYLNTIRAKFSSLRGGGAKCVLRFCYSNGMNASDKPWDATEEQVLRHIAQVKPLIQEYADVILVVQAGFIGSWGEWYYTDNFKTDASRKAVVEALLDAVPENRQIELRTPAFKMNLYGVSLADTITRATAHQPTTKSRLGGHNDCYLADSNDTGTYRNSTDRKLWESESAYTIMGGETCGLSDYCHCEKGEAKAARGVLADMAANHFTYLNISYHPSVINRWKTEGCYDELQRRLGYRYVLDKGQFTGSPTAGESFRVVLNLHNEGFSPVQNPRDAEFVLSDKSGKVVKTYPLNSDPRYWMPGQNVTIDQTFTLPSGISGEMTLSLNLPDPSENLRSNPYFSIRMANEDIWDETTGYNELYTFTL